MPTPPSDVYAQATTASSVTDFPASIKNSPIAKSSQRPPSADVDLGARLKILREAHGLSQRELAKRAGITNSNISMIEQGQVSPSVHSLTRILNAFPMTLADFFSCDLALLDTCIFRARDRENHKQVTAEGVVIQRLAPANTHPQVDTQVQSFPGGFSGRIERHVSTQDWSGVITHGALQLWLGAKCYELAVGDGFYIPRGIDCRVINPASELASMVSCSLFVRYE